MVIKDIVAQHPESVALLFLKYGINKPVDEQSLTAAIISCGEQFVIELATVIANQYEHYNNFPGIGKKKKVKKKALKKAQTVQASNAQKAATGILPPRMPNEAIPLLGKELSAELVPRNAAVTEMAAQVTAQVNKTKVTNGGGFWDTIGNIIGGIKGITNDVREIRNPSQQPPVGSGGGMSGSGSGSWLFGDEAGGGDQPGDGNKSEQPFKKWMLAAIAVVVVLVVVLVATSGSKPIAK